MPKIKWGVEGKKKFGLGVSNGVLYVRNAQGEYKPGVAWDGLTSVQETPEGAETTKLYADNTEYGSVTSKETFGATIEAYWSPEEFDECDGIAHMSSGIKLAGQTRKVFGLCYRTEIQDDISETAGYVLHCVYGCKASPSEKSHSTINDSPEAETLSWTITTTPTNVTGFKPVAHLQLSSLVLTQAQMAAVEDALYGTDGGSGSTGTEAYLPTPDQLNTIINSVVNG